MNKNSLLSNRKKFFKEIIRVLSLEPNSTDDFLNQSNYYIKPQEKKTILNEEFGDLVVEINGCFHGKTFKVNYSLWQLSDNLKIGVAINDLDLQGAFATDQHNEINELWGDNLPDIDVSKGSLFYTWNFSAPSLYDSYKEQEKFIFGVRHMHFRTMKVVHDECFKISQNK